METERGDGNVYMLHKTVADLGGGAQGARAPPIPVVRAHA